MLKAKQLSTAKTIVESFLQASSENVRKPVQITAWDGTSTTAFLTAVGCIFLGWWSRPAAKATDTVGWYEVPKDWDEADLTGNVLTTKGERCPLYSSKENAEKAMTALLEGTRGEPWAGIKLESFCDTHKGYKFVVCHKHTVFFVWSDKAPGKEAVWANSMTDLPNVVFPMNDNVNTVMQAMYNLDPECRVRVTKHPSGAVIIHIVSDAERTEVDMVAARASAIEGTEVWLSMSMKTTTINKASFEDIINTKKGENEMADAVSMSDLNAILGKAPEKSTGKKPVEAKQEEGLKKPVEEVNPPWDEEKATVSKKETAQPEEKPIQKEQVAETTEEKTVPEYLDDLVLQIEELQTAIGDWSSRAKALKATVKAISKRHKAESKTIKRSAEDARKIEDYDRMAAKMAKFEKLIAE